MDPNLSQLAESGNPWHKQDKSLTGLRKALVLGERTGHVANVSMDITWLENMNNQF